MTAAEICSALRNKLGDGAAAFQVPAAGDPSVQIAAPSLREAALFLRDAPELSFDYLRLITGVDRKDVFCSVYHLYSYRHRHAVTLHVELPRDNPEVDSVMDIWPAAEWLEREAFDMLGINYRGHRDLKRILLPPDWEGHPLRKDYEQPREYHGIKHE